MYTSFTSHIHAQTIPYSKGYNNYTNALQHKHSLQHVNMFTHDLIDCFVIRSQNFTTLIIIKFNRIVVLRN